MAKSFAELRKKRPSAADLAQKLEDASGKKKDFKDNRFWKPTKDKAGNAMATIRFLPAAKGDEMPWVRVFTHGFKSKSGKWLFENCPTTLENECPICAANSKLWNTGDKKNQEIVRERKRKLKYIANILVISDPNNPDAEGKVFLYEFGKKIFDKITDAANPEFEDENPVNVFDFWDGADFKLKVRKVEGYDNYDKSEFASPSELFGGDEDKLEALWESQYSLAEFVDPKNFKSADELQKRLDAVLSDDGGKSGARRSVDEDVEDDETPPPSKKFTPADEDDDEDDEDDPLAKFKELMNSDDD